MAKFLIFIMIFSKICTHAPVILKYQSQENKRIFIPEDTRINPKFYIQDISSHTIEKDGRYRNNPYRDGSIFPSVEGISNSELSLTESPINDASHNFLFIHTSLEAVTRFEIRTPSDPTAQTYYRNMECSLTLFYF